MSTDFMIIHKDIAPQFLETLKEVLQEAQQSAVSLPLVVSSDSASRIAAMVKDAISKGADVFSGKAAPTEDNSARVTPTVIGHVSQEMELWKEEAFGPLMGYITVANEDEAVALANKPGYGLSASIFTKDLRTAFALAKRIHSGYVSVSAINETY